ncbi:c-type lysozyme inhibitor [Pasteurella canis]|uniref:Lysozyme inhibitor n=1 Tax=Pasteurella canis TaxID=753 RepID=A0A379EVH6_9PAST|nr:c-type lysozyme inhibitor [Pasteurella canis]UAY78646.1 c-type lysozyme inhibitor [Pasteurella canis]UEC22354.1 c-type lysozyme inhibitor [Pasteurella canis]SPY32280.1 putative C-type lysozyme, inhibitor [Pasteurella canis]SUC10144.1 putative C-type lysozyme, inhibitor [Pasteurella canis]GJH42514.1 lysozyme inhibitor [Pasteurella canis]
MKLKKATLLVLAILPLTTAITAQATIIESSSKGELTKVVYSCEGKNTLDVIFINTAQDSFAIINQVDEMIPMELVKSASGANYKAINKNYTYQLQTKGNQAMLFGDDKLILGECVTE